MLRTDTLTIRWRYDGDMTSCIIETAEREQLVVETALRHTSDAFVKDKGRRISLARALKTGGFDKETRREVWEAYRTMGGSEKWTKQ